MLQAGGKVHVLSNKWILRLKTREPLGIGNRWPQEQVGGKLLLFFCTFKILNHISVA